MSHCTLPSSLIAGKFLGSRDRLIVAGNSPNSNVGIQYVARDDETGESYFENKCELFFPEICTGLEICGISRLAKSFVALANTDQSGNGDSSIALIDVETDILEAGMKHSHTLEGGSSSAYSSLSFYSDQELLAAATDSGSVVLWDLNSGKEIRRFTADSCGLSKLEFTRSGQLLTCGHSTSTQLHVWDVRTSLSSSSISSASPAELSKSVTVSASRSLLHPEHYAIGQTQPRQHLYYTSISSQSIYNKIICGTSGGSIAVWDFRSEAVSVFQPYSPDASVTAVLAHPWHQDLLISSSSSGLIRSSDLLDLSNGISQDFDSPSKSEVIVSEPGEFTSIDCDRDSGMLLAVSALGGLWRLQLEK